MTNNLHDNEIIRAIHHSEDALKYLKSPKHFCPFSRGLTKLLQEYGYQGSEEDPQEKAEYLWNQLKPIWQLHRQFGFVPKPPTKTTIQNWFQYDQSRPSLTENSREHMFQICFALSVSLEDVNWFFHKVYLGRSFNCHTEREAVYYYCFSNQLPYERAQEFIEIIKRFPQKAPNAAKKKVFTEKIIERLKCCRSDEEFLHYFERNKDVFDKWNITASEHMQRRLAEIKGEESDKETLQSCKNIYSVSLRKLLLEELKQNRCGLVIQEHLINVIQRKSDDLFGKTITSANFMLDRILLTQEGIPKEADIPAGIRINFPSKSTFSRISPKKSGKSVSYDSIRKCLILLEFYHFWVSILREEILNPDSQTANDAFDQYCRETNDMLHSCGYGDLFPGNPYDWLFLWASSTEAPLDSLRSLISDILVEEQIPCRSQQGIEPKKRGI